MPRVVVTARAAGDFSDIIAYLADTAGVATATAYNLKMQRLSMRLAAHPDSGPVRPELGRHIRLAILDPYLVFYRHVPSEQLVSILRIVHGRRRIRSRDFVSG